jgi:integrase
MLNKTVIKRLRPREKMYRILDGDGLYIEVRTNGEKYWRFRFKKLDGKSTMVSLGRYPDIGIEEARIERDFRRRQMLYGDISFAEVSRQWHEHKNYNSEKNSMLERSRVENYLIPRLGRMKIAEIKPANILPILKTIEASGHLELARRVRSIASQIFRYGVVNLMCDSDPAGLLVGATKRPVVRHMPAITDEAGFKGLLQAIEKADSLMPSVKFCLQVAPYVVLRSGEIRHIRPDQVDFDKRLLVIPADIMKTKKDHLVPLHSSVVRLLELALEFSNDDFIFPGARPGRPISENTLNMALRSLGFDKDTAVFHGFRSSFSTLGREVHRFEDDLIERQLAHIDRNAVRAAYDRSHRLEERTAMQRLWGDYLDRLKAG